MHTKNTGPLKSDRKTYFDHFESLNSSGGLLGTIPVICGGKKEDTINSQTYLNSCLLYGTSQVITMNTSRGAHSSVALNNRHDHLVIQKL